jgi:hypothetical protein
MTLGQFFESCSQNSSDLLIYFISLPATAALILLIGKGEGHMSPWKYIYTLLVYGACIPGIFSVSLSIYKFLFERGKIMDSNMYTQILPILSMFLTLTLIKKNVSLDEVPGFDKISSLILMISVLLVIMWILEKTNLFVFTYMPFYQFILMLIGVLILMRFLIKRAL